MKVNRHKLNHTELPELLKLMADPPKQIYVLGQSLDNIMAMPRVAIVGSRKPSAYGREVAYRLAKELASSGVVIISGLAFGIDSIAHKAALEAGGVTVAVLPSSIDHIYPASHRGLAQQIIENGGALVSEYEKGEPIMKHNFIGRNRIISGLSDAVLIPQAAVNSGSLHTANFALEQGRTVLAVPGPINDPFSEGTNNLIKSGAQVTTTVNDVLAILNLPTQQNIKKIIKGSENEKLLYGLIFSGINSQEELINKSGLKSSEFNMALTGLEISGHIRAQGGGNWACA